ncbi:hypothetical protein ABZU32_22700 [Sphaerisporangium sp. NPDC005288]|uniref:hypothetical protein n=1 Tax=Sphaerisporangium sp. NPDC005288 TaxID=3155114 RepID=UPI0033B3081F
MSLKDMVQEIGRVGVKMSISTLSRSEAGTRDFKRAELQAITAILASKDVHLRPPPCDENSADVAHVPMPPTQDAPGPLSGSYARSWHERASHPRSLRSRHASVLGVVGLLVVVGSVLLLMPFMRGTAVTFLRGTATTPAISPPSTTHQPPPHTCARYRVAARDLWLRNRYGKGLVQLPQDTEIAYSGEQNAAGHWEITTADGRHGWVDSAYLEPRC